MPDSPFLLTPGPVPVPREVLRKLKLVYRTQNDVLLFTASGTGAFESV